MIEIDIQVLPLKGRHCSPAIARLNPGDLGIF
jgi:hypothetical protein